MIRRIEVRAEDSLILRAWRGSAFRPTLGGEPVEDLAVIPVVVVTCLELAPARVRIVTDEGAFDTALGPPPEISGMFRRGGDWWGSAEDCGNLRSLIGLAMSGN